MKKLVVLAALAHLASCGGSSSGEPVSPAVRLAYAAAQGRVESGVLTEFTFTAGVESAAGAETGRFNFQLLWEMEIHGIIQPTPIYLDVEVRGTIRDGSATVFRITLDELLRAAAEKLGGDVRFLAPGPELTVTVTTAEGFDWTTLRLRYLADGTFASEP